jgi:8-oxo-dGTP pyrophosphatase MutT (NUDIX family)
MARSFESETCAGMQVLVKPWDVLTTRVIVDKPWLTVHEQRVRTARGIEMDYHLLDAADWVCVVCLTNSNHIVLVRQYRHGVRRATLELPAGAINCGEEPLAAAQRELREETGYVAPQWQLLRQVHPETTRHRHLAHIYLALDARLDGEQTLDATEDVDVVVEPWDAAVVDKLEHAVHVAGCLLANAKHSFGSDFKNTNERV